MLIARALITRPDALLLDEPTSGLDLVARQRFMESVRRLTREGTTLILVTHHVDEIIPETSRVVLLRAGRIAFDGPPEAALTAARLAEVFGGRLAVERSGGYYHVVRRGRERPLSIVDADFAARYPEYAATAHLDALRATEVPPPRRAGARLSGLHRRQPARRVAGPRDIRSCSNGLVSRQPALGKPRLVADDNAGGTRRGARCSTGSTPAPTTPPCSRRTPPAR